MFRSDGQWILGPLPVFMREVKNEDVVAGVDVSEKKKKKKGLNHWGESRDKLCTVLV